MYYGILFLLLCIFSIYGYYSPEGKYFKSIKLLAFTILVTTSGLRYQTAVDWLNYQIYFEQIEPISRIFNKGILEFFIAYPKEPLFTILNS
jgi:hypothetical protein